MAVKYKTLTVGEFLNDEQLNAETRGGWRLISHAAWAHDQRKSPVVGPFINYVFEYNGGIGASKSIMGSSR